MRFSITIFLIAYAILCSGASCEKYTNRIKENYIDSSGILEFLICKKVSIVSHLSDATLVAAYIRYNDKKQHGSSRKKKYKEEVLLLLVNNKTNKIISKKKEIVDDNKTRKMHIDNIVFDAGKYWINKDVTAFGLRFYYKNSSEDSIRASSFLNLYYVQENKIFKVLDMLDVFDFSGVMIQDACKGLFKESKKIIVLENRMHRRFHDLKTINIKSTFQPEWVQNYGCVNFKKNAIKEYRSLYFDGILYQSY